MYSEVINKMRMFYFYFVNLTVFRVRKPPNLPKVGVAKHKVGGANLKVGGADASPTV